MEAVETPEDMVSALEGLVERLKVIAEGDNEPLTDNVSEVTLFCRTLETILRHQQKDKISFWGERRDYWNYLTEGTGGMKTLEGIAKQVQALSQLTSGQGRGRALVRCCLSSHILADCLQNSVSNGRRTRDWYHTNAILLMPSYSQRVISALYDLTDVNFDLPSDGLDLDETWPSFVLKSFQSPDHKRSLLQVLSSTKEAKAADHEKSNQRSMLERAVEEQPTEVFVKQEIPFNLDLVGKLMNEIRCRMIGQSTGHTSLPPLTVGKLDDITSSLVMMRDYTTLWTQEISRGRRSVQEELKNAKECITDLELQVRETMRESESSETTLLSRLQHSHTDLKNHACNLQRATNDVTCLGAELSRSKQKVMELEALNFSLEEKLIELELRLEEKGEGEGEGEGSLRSMSSLSSVQRDEVDGGERRRRGYTMVETTLAAKDGEISKLAQELVLLRENSGMTEGRMERALEQVAGYSQTLELQLASECEAKDSISQNFLRLHQTHAELEESHLRCVEEVERLREELVCIRERELTLQGKCEELQCINTSLSVEVEGLVREGEEEVKGREEEVRGREEEVRGREKMAREREVEARDLRERLELELKLRQELERERDSAKEEVQSMHGLVEHETQSLKFQLSSQTMELRQTKELLVEKDRKLSSVSSSLSTAEKQLEEERERSRVAEEQVRELRQELQDVEGILRNSQVEMTSLHSQLTEKTLSRDKERADILHLQNELDSVNMRLYCEKQEFGKQLRNLGEENQDLRRAFKGLLQQKVTLWQHADELEQEQVAMGEWIDSKTILECMGCSAVFSVFNRKHHCRACGKVFCTGCCNRKSQLPFSRAPVRVCDKCNEKISQLRTPLASKVVNSLDISESLESSLLNSSPQTSSGNQSPVQRRTSNTLNLERNVDIGGNSLQARLRQQNPDDLDLSLTDTPGSSLSGSTPQFSAVNSLQTDRLGDAPDSVSFKSLSSNDYSIDPELRHKERAKEQEDFYNICEVDGASSDDSYYLISTKSNGSEFPVGMDVPGNAQLDVTALASRLASLEPSLAEQVTPIDSSLPQRVVSPTIAAAGEGGRQGERARVGTSEFLEVSLEGGGEHRVPVEVDKTGVVVAWQFSTEPKGIAFGISYMTSGNSGKEQEVLPLRRCMSHKTPLTGEYVAQKCGVYVLRFDNRHSKFSGRKLLYRIWMKPAL